ncbi:TOBE domain-containing protein [Maribacter sp.]|uniref:TOBE domain-containing protein n=1 Tax=Maribacter sp. TaxID=1897614 RepID=UPI0025BC4F25|nr:TOBE domain-containing protein [Maribacter sp.]
MNSFKGNISHINTKGNLSIITIQINDKIKLKSIVVETPKTASFLHINNEIAVLFKETEVIISIDQNSKSSVQNSILGTIKSIEKGALLSKVNLATSAGDLTTIISTDAITDLNLKIDLKVTALIKLNEIMLSNT